MFTGFEQRQRHAEWMDSPHVNPPQLKQSLRFIRRVNWLLRYTRVTVDHLERFSRKWQRDERIDILDLATGSADIPKAILRWATSRGFDVHIVGVDLHGQTVRAAAGQSRDDPRLRIVQADVLAPPFEDASFDYVHCAMFLHHLDDADAVRVLRIMDRLARRGIIASDLLRRRRAYGWIKLLTLAANPMIRHDAAVSVRQAFSADEVLSLRARAGLEYADYHTHFAHRWSLAGDKSAVTG